MFSLPMVCIYMLYLVRYFEALGALPHFNRIGIASSRPEVIDTLPQDV